MPNACTMAGCPAQLIAASVPLVLPINIFLAQASLAGKTTVGRDNPWQMNEATTPSQDNTSSNTKKQDVGAKSATERAAATQSTAASSGIDKPQCAGNEAVEDHREGDFMETDSSDSLEKAPSHREKNSTQEARSESATNSKPASSREPLSKTFPFDDSSQAPPLERSPWSKSRSCGSATRKRKQHSQSSSTGSVSDDSDPR